MFMVTMLEVTQLCVCCFFELQYAEMSLAHELTSPLEKDLEEERLSVSYCITVARLHLFVKNFSEAQKYLKIATRKNIMVSVCVCVCVCYSTNLCAHVLPHRTAMLGHCLVTATTYQVITQLLWMHTSV